MPDLTYPGQVCGMTAQYAQRPGKLVVRYMAASLGHGTRKEYKHDDLGLLVDLGGPAAAANPLNVPLSGPAANALTRGYHLYPMSDNRMRVLACRRSPRASASRRRALSWRTNLPCSGAPCQRPKRGRAAQM